MSKRITRISRSRTAYHQERHRYEHWLVDNQFYFITARCRDKFPAFVSEQAKLIFWDRFEHYTKKYEFVPWVTSLLDNHYHSEGYLKDASVLPTMMQRIHGSIAKLVNDVLPERLTEFWRDARVASTSMGVFATRSRDGSRIGTRCCRASVTGSSLITGSIRTRA